jgi:hypothetical protein
MTKRPEPPPSVTSEAEQRAFWGRHDSTAHVGWRRAGRVRVPALKPSTRVISLRLPVGLLERIRIAAERRDVPHRSLLKIWLDEEVEGG